MGCRSICTNCKHACWLCGRFEYVWCLFRSEICTNCSVVYGFCAKSCTFLRWGRPFLTSPFYVSLFRRYAKNLIQGIIRPLYNFAHWNTTLKRFCMVRVNKMERMSLPMVYWICVFVEKRQFIHKKRRFCPHFHTFFAKFAEKKTFLPKFGKNWFAFFQM